MSPLGKKKIIILKKSYYRELFVFAIYRPLMFMFASMASILVLYLMTDQIINAIQSGASVAVIVVQIKSISDVVSICKRHI